MCMLLGMSKQLVYEFTGFYNKETISSNILFIPVERKGDFLVFLDLKSPITSFVHSVMGFLFQ